MRHFESADGLSLAYSDTGAGLPLLCLPGLTRNAADFDDLKAAIGREVRMICPTYRGRGASDHAADFRSYNVAQEARDVLALLDHLDIEKALVLGTSRGGLIAMMIAIFDKPRLAGVILNDIGPELAAAGLDKIRDYVGIAPLARTYGEAAKALSSNLRGQFPDVPLARWAVAAERWFEEVPDGLALRYDPKLRDAMLAQDAKPAPDLWPLFEALEGVPLGLIRAANSDLLTKDGVAKMKAKRPDMVFAEVPNRGHVPFLDEAESLAVIHALIDRIS